MKICLGALLVSALASAEVAVAEGASLADRLEVLEAKLQRFEEREKEFVAALPPIGSNVLMVGECPGPSYIDVTSVAQGRYVVIDQRALEEPYLQDGDDGTHYHGIGHDHTAAGSVKLPFGTVDIKNGTGTGRGGLQDGGVAPVDVSVNIRSSDSTEAGEHTHTLVAYRLCQRVQ